MNEKKSMTIIEKLIEEGECEKALALIDANIKEGNQSSRQVNAKAVALMLLGRYQEAKDTYDRAMIDDRSLEAMDKYYNLIEIYSKLGMRLSAAIHQYRYAIGAQDAESREYILYITEQTKEKENHIIQAQDTITEQDYFDLAYLYAIQGYVLDFVFLLMSVKVDVNKFREIDQLWRCLDCVDQAGGIYIVVESERYPLSQVLLQSLCKLSDKIYYIKLPVECCVEGLDYAEGDLAKLSFQNQEKKGDLIFLTPLLLIDQNTGKKLDTTGKLIAHLCRHKEKDKEHQIILSQDRYGDLVIKERLHTIPMSRDWYGWNYHQADWHLYRIGTYERIYSPLYGFSIREALSQAPEVKISVVIPVRGCPDSLPYTLRSCLDQDYEDYEIVLSDNGAQGDERVRELAETLNAKCEAEGRRPKIRYYRTPGLLPLPKSFEYAYLRARGEFLFGLGADDALMPDGLRVLARCIDEHPHIDIIEWKRYEYFWPDMHLGRSDLMVYHPHYTQGVYTAEPMRGEVILTALLSEVMHMYRLPMCYINSGMRRSYMQKIIDRTGTLIGGASQDVYMGLLNLYLNQEILMMNYPVTIAGQGASSLGAQAFAGVRSEEAQEKAAAEYWGLLVQPEMETSSQAKMPVTNWDRTLLINQLLRVQDLGLGRLTGDDQIDYRQLFEQALEQLSPVDQRFDWYLERMTQAAKLHGEAFERWFAPLAEQTAASRDARRQTFLERLEPKTKMYKEKVYDSGFVWEDMSKHDIHDIYAAAQYAFSKMRPGEDDEQFR